MESEIFQPLVLMGLVFLIIGIALLSIPFLARLIPSDLKIPSFLLYVYRGDNFYFVTSPLLILISLVYLLLFLLRAFGSR